MGHQRGSLSDDGRAYWDRTGFRYVYGDILPLFEADPDTKAVAVFGEIGGLMKKRPPRQ